MPITIPFQSALDAVVQAQHNKSSNLLTVLLKELSPQSTADLGALLPHAATLPDEHAAIRLVEEIAQARPEWINAFSHDEGRAMTALHIAVQRNSLVLVDCLLEMGADPKLNTGWGFNALEMAAGGGGNARLLEAITTAILERGVFDREDKDKALIVAADNGNLGAVRALMKEGAGFSWVGGGHNGDMGTALAVASFHSEEDWSSEKIVAAMLASKKAIKVLDQGWDNDSYGSAVHCAAFSGNAKVLGLLVQAGASVNPPDDMDEEYPNTPLMAAADGIQPDTMKILIEAGADATLVNNRGRNALHHLAGADGHGGDPEDASIKQCMTLLVAAGCDPNAADDHGLTPAQVAKEAGRSTLARALAKFAPKTTAVAKRTKAPKR